MKLSEGYFFHEQSSPPHSLSHPLSKITIPNIQRDLKNSEIRRRHLNNLVCNYLVVNQIVLLLS